LKKRDPEKKNPPFDLCYNSALQDPLLPHHRTCIERFLCVNLLNIETRYWVCLILFLLSLAMIH
jgi:hypothetical protein